VREADTGFWELPGGRIDAGEEWHAHADVLAREMAEELGCGLRLRFGPEAVTWTRQRPWDGIFIFLVARIGWLECGEPVLSGEHMELAWLGPEAAEGLSFPPASGYRDAVRTLWRLVAQD
jgi:8-oxo-dGTP pyrophosphatase MutT (NUDIX family)